MRQASPLSDSWKVQSESALTRASLKVAGWRPGEGVRQVITIQMMEPGCRQMVGGGGRLVVRLIIATFTSLDD